MGFVISLLMGMIIIPRVLIISFRKRLFDTPDARKIHTLPIPRLGGVTFFPAILFTMCLLIASRIRSADPRNLLSRGYTLVTDSAGRVLKSASSVKAGDGIRVLFADGALEAEVKSNSN